MLTPRRRAGSATIKANVSSPRSSFTQKRHGSQEKDKPKSKLIKTSKEEADEGQDGFVSANPEIPEYLDSSDNEEYTKLPDPTNLTNASIVTEDPNSESDCNDELYNEV